MVIPRGKMKQKVMEQHDSSDNMEQMLRQKFLQGLDKTLRNKVRYKPFTTYEALVAETNKYALRLDGEKEEKDKREFINAVDNNSTSIEILIAIEKLPETINALATGTSQMKARSDILRMSVVGLRAPVVLVEKKYKSLRFCVDYRKLNSVTIKDSFPLPRIDTTLDQLHGKKFFTTLDLASGYWQIELEESAKEKTAFIVENNLYQFKRMAFGLCNAPATFQRTMNYVLRDVLGKKALVYLDDVIIFSDKFEAHLEDIREEPFVWTDEDQVAFETLRTCLTTKPILAYPDFSKQFLLFTDACNYGIGAILSQIQDGNEVVIAYASRQLRKPELNNATVEKEALAVIFAIKSFRHYLLDEPFLVISDHSPLQWLQNQKDNNGRQYS
ncbi:Uncharacterized protein APZ42_030182 [Daphnia magna]|uniref:Reverse transcriptase domain-containing protein n=1 Tax=Daphnia magna TaxID=35525 RepID=A0A164NZM5_9CRUS|nr:Uncharacterized protein APZ42_030182 [Daphnia magna]